MSNTEYEARIDRWADRLAAAGLTDAQADGRACLACGVGWLTRPDIPSVPVGLGPHGHVFVCTPCDEARIEAVSRGDGSDWAAVSVDEPATSVTIHRERRTVQAGFDDDAPITQATHLVTTTFVAAEFGDTTLAEWHAAIAAADMLPNQATTVTVRVDGIWHTADAVRFQHDTQTDDVIDAQVVTE